MELTALLIVLGSIVGFIIVMCLIGTIVYGVINKKNSIQSSGSLPQGGDDSATARMLADKYRAERESGEFKREF